MQLQTRSILGKHSAICVPRERGPGKGLQGVRCRQPLMGLPKQDNEADRSLGKLPGDADGRMLTILGTKTENQIPSRLQCNEENSKKYYTSCTILSIAGKWINESRLQSETPHTAVKVKKLLEDKGYKITHVKDSWMGWVATCTQVPWEN